MLFGDFCLKLPGETKQKNIFFRNNLPYGNIKLTNKYGKILKISTKDIKVQFI